MRRERGVALLVTLLLLVAVVLLGASASTMALLGERSARAERDRLIAFQAAEDGLMDAENDINSARSPVVIPTPPPPPPPPEPPAPPAPGVPLQPPAPPAPPVPGEPPQPPAPPAPGEPPQPPAPPAPPVPGEPPQPPVPPVPPAPAVLPAPPTLPAAPAPSALDVGVDAPPSASPEPSVRAAWSRASVVVPATATPPVPAERTAVAEAARAGSPLGWQLVDLEGADATELGGLSGAVMETGEGTLPFKRPRYYVERLARSGGGYYYRVTVIGFGNRPGTEVVLQSTYRRAADYPPGRSGRLSWREIPNWRELHAAATGRDKK